MRRIDQICGLAVVDIESGAKIGDVIQVFLDAESQRLDGIAMQSRGFARKQSFIGFGDIEIFGDVSVLVKGGSANAKRRKRSEKNEQQLEVGQRVYLRDGTDIGWLTNVLINEVSGEIHSLEVSKGYIDDLFGERSWISEFSCGRQGISALSKGRS